jgi:YD repeat-containing protein
LSWESANWLLISSSSQRLITYTGDDRGNLTSDGVFTYTYNSAGRLVQAQSITATIVYTYTADGLRVAQAVAGAVTTYAWDWASAVPELLQTCNLQSALAIGSRR